MGLILGGVLTQYLSWRWTLYVNLVFAVIAVAGALAYMRSSRPAHRPRMDWTGAVLACAGLFRIVFGFSHAETAGWTAGLTIGSLVLPLAPAIAATHGYTVAFAVSAGTFGLGVILAIVLLPSRQRLAELRAAAPAAAPTHAAAAPAADLAPQLEVHAIPVALPCCSPVINPASLPAARAAG